MAEKRKTLKELLAESGETNASNANNSAATNTTRKSLKELLLEDRAPSAIEDINARLKKYAEDSYNFSQVYTSRYFDEEGNYLNQYRSDANDWFERVLNKNAYLSSEAHAIGKALETYKAYIPEDSYKEISDMLATNSKALSDIYSSSREDRDFWSQFKNEDAYKAALAKLEEDEAKRTYDLEAAKTELDELRSELEARQNNPYFDVSYVTDFHKDMQEDPIGTMQSKKYSKEALIDNRNRYRDENAKRVSELKKLIGEKEAYYNQAERVQDAYKLGSVSNPESEFYDPEFERYAQMGEALSVPSMFDASAYNGEIQNPAKYARENWEANGKSEKWLENDYKAYEDFNIDTRYLKMTDDEYKTYNYYLGKDSENARRGQKTNLADEYFASIEEDLNVRLGAEIGEAANDKGAVYQTLFGLAMGAKTNLESLGTIFSKEDYIPTSVYQSANQVVAQDMADKGWVADKAYQTSNVIGNMLPSIAIGAATGGLGGMVGGTAGAILTVGGQIAANAEMGLASAGNAYQGMLNEGYNKDQARLYGGLVGASEATLQYLLGGVSALGGKLSGGVMSKVLSKVDSALGRFAIKYAGSIGSEIAEEELQLFVEPFLKSAIFDMDYEAPSFDEMLDTAIVTFFSTGLLEGPGAVMGEINTRNDGKAIKEEGKVDRLVKLGKTYSVDTVAYQLAKKVDENTGAYTIGRLLNEVNASLSEQNRTDIKNALIEKGVTEAQAETLAKWMNHVVEGGNLTKKQQVALEANDVLGEVLYGTIIQPNSTVMQRKQTLNQLYDIASSMGVDRQALEAQQTPEAITQRMNDRRAFGEALRRGANSRMGLSEADIAQIDEVATKIRESSAPSSAKIADVADKVSDTGKTVIQSTGEEVSIKKIASTDAKNKTMKLELDNGKVVDSKDIAYGDNNQAALYESVLQMGYDTHTANAIVHGYTPSSTVSVEEYIIGTRQAFNYGWGHIPEKARIGDGYKALTQEQREYAVKLGEDARAADDKVRGIRAAQKQSQVTKKKPEGGYKARLDADVNHISARAKESVKALDAVAKALKINIVVKDLKGNAYGIYNPATNEMTVDINAGGDGTLLFTASHELVHYIRNWSPAKFTILADFLMEQYSAKGEDIDARIDDEIKKAYNASRGKHQMTYDEAYEEVVAQAMQRFLTDSNFIERLAALQKKDANLAKRLVAKLKEILESIRTAYQGMNTKDRASQAVQEMGKAIDELYAKMEEGLIAASEASHSIGSRNLEDFAEAKNTDGKELFQYKAMEADEEAYRQMLKKHGIMSESEINNLFSTIDKALVIIKNNLEILDYAWEADIDDRSFSPVKPNSDNLYKVSLDFSTLCRKRILQQVIQTQLQDALNKPLSREESIAIRDELMKIQEEGRQIEIACALCYVESARMKSPAQIKKFLKDRERVINEFLASKSGGDIKQKIKQAEADARERLGVGNAPLKSMPGKIADQIRAAKRQARQSYVPTAEEQKLIDAASSMTVTDFTSPEGLENLAKNYPVLFDAYTSFVRNATKSKGIEKDKWWRAGDSKSIGDTLIANMNRENGLRSQSWSDFQVIHLLDYIAATIELSTRNAKEQAYSKVPDYIELMGNTGVMLNMSLIPMAKFNGKLEYDGVEGMAYKKALELREKYHATAGTICIGISDEQIKMLLDDSSIDYVIPYHKSGMAAHIRKLMHIPTWSEYEKYQNETNLSRAEAIKQAKKYGVKLLNESDENYQKHTAFSEWFDIEEARQIAKQENAFPTDAKLQKKYGAMYGGYMAMQNAANNYLKLCAERGIAPKFSHENANFTEEANYWKLIIDRKMVDNVTGEIIEQQAIKPIFDEGEILRILNDELERYPSVKADQDYATRTVVEKFLSGKMNDRLDADTVAAIMQKPVDNITTTNIIASEDGIKAQYIDTETDKAYMDAVNSGDTETAQKMVDEAAKKAGFTIKAYHGTNADFTVFDKNRVGKGIDQYGAGFYFASNPDVTEAYGKKRYDTYLNIKKPINLISKPGGSGKTLYDVRLTQTQAYQILKRHPLMYDAENSPLGDFYDEYWEVGAKEWMVRDLAKKYDSIGFLDGDVILYRDYPNELHEAIRDVLGYDGVRVYFETDAMVDERNDYYYVAWFANQIKSSEPVVKDDDGNIIPLSERFNSENDDIRYQYADKSFSGRYSYEELTSKPDMKLTLVGGTAPNNRADIIVAAKKNAVKVGKFNPKDGSVSVHVDDINADVILGTDGLKHGLRRKKGLQNNANAIVTLKAGEILKNSIRVNELIPSKENASGSYVLIGAAQSSSGELYVARFVVNKFSNELTSMDVLYAVNAKKELAVLNAPRSTAKPLSVTSSYTSIAQLLDFVNKHFPDILPESVLRHYGYDARPDGELGEDALYQYADLDAIDNRGLLAKALEGAAKTDLEKQKLKEYQSKVSLINAEEKKLRELRGQIKEISFSKGPRDTEKLKKLQFDAKQAANRINVYDKQLLRLEATKPLMDVVQREKELVRKKMEQQRKKDIAAVKEKNAATIREIMNRNTESREKAMERRNMAQIRNKIKAFKAKLESNLLTPTDRGYVPFGLAQAMIDVCSLIDTDTDLYKSDGNINKSQVQRNLTKDKLQALKDEYEKLKDYDDPVYSGEFDDAIYLMLKDLKENYEGRTLKEMSLDELRDMYDILRSIGDTLADARNLIGKGESTDVYEAGDAIISEQREVARKRKKDKRSGAQKAKDGIINLSLAPVRNVERMSGYKEDSVLVDLFNDFEIGMRQRDFFEMEAKKSFEAIITGENAKAYEAAVYDAFGNKSYMDAHGKEFSISKMQMMQAILSQDRERANGMNHIKGGGLVFADLNLLRKGDLGEAISAENSHLVSNADGVVEQFRQELANDKWAQDYMAAARAFFDGKAKDAINNTMLTLKHRILAKDKNYIPFEVDKNFVVREISAANDIQQTINSYGMLQETKDKAPQPLIITGLNNIIDRHIDQVSAIVGLAVPVRNFNKVWNVHSVDGVDTTVNDIIEKNWGKEGKEFINQVVQDIQGPRHNTHSELYKKIKSGYIGATFLLNGSVVTKQIASMFSATSMIRWRDPASMMGNLLYTMVNYKKIAAEVDKYTASAWKRRQGMSDAEVYTLLTEGKKHPITKALNKLPAPLNPAKWITAMDSAVALSLWKYAKQDVKRAHPELSGEELNRATASFYDSVIENTQSMTDVLHRPEIQKRSDIMSEAFGTFKTDTYQMAGQLQNAMGRFVANKSKENAHRLGKTVYSIAASAIWGSLMTTAFALLRYKVNPYRDDEDDELTVESWLKRQGFAFGGDLMGYFLPLFGSEVIGTIENIVYGESEDIADSLALTAINDLYSTAVGIASTLKEGEAPSIDDYKKLLTKSLQVFGIPANNLLRTIDAIRLHAKDIANGEFFSFEAGRDKSNGQSLYEAILRGNEEQIEKLQLKFDDDDAIDNALVRAIRENNPEVAKAASKYINGDISAFESAVAALVKQGFEEDVAARAIRSVITMVNSAARLKADGDTKDYDKKVDNLIDLGYDADQLERDIAVVDKQPSEDDSDEASSIYKTSDINVALENGNATTARKIIDELVQVKIGNYMSEGDKKSEAKKKAESSVKSSLTSYWKPLYLKAKANKDLNEVKRIKALLKATKLYDDVTKTTDEWWVAYRRSN